jgi:putative acetyltransferase
MTTAPAPLAIHKADPQDPRIGELIARHFALMHSLSPPESVHAQDAAALVASGAVLLAAAEGEHVLGIGAVKMIAPEHAELKSMHTVAEARGRGVARALLLALLDEARRLGAQRVSLETGAEPEFEPARALYLRNGFALCGPFGTYSPDPLSVFMTRAL